MAPAVKCKECRGRGSTPEIRPCLTCRRHGTTYGIGRDGTGCAACEGTGRDYHTILCWKCVGRGSLPRPRMSWYAQPRAVRRSMASDGLRKDSIKRTVRFAEGS